MEIWKDIPDYEGHYQVSTFGNVKSLGNNQLRKGKEKIMSPGKNTEGYYFVNLYKNKIKKSQRVHRLVGLAFLPNYYNKPFIDHKNRIKLDNRLINLRWVTSRENSMNMSKRNNTSSQYIGVYWDTEKSKWCASIKYYKKKIHIGYFDDEFDAHLAYEEKKKELYPNI